MIAERRVAYVLLRVLLGINLFGHGLIRTLHGQVAFAEGMVKSMADTPLPRVLVYFFAVAIPAIELALGLMLVAGLATRRNLIFASLFLSALMLGVTLKQDWPTAGLQLVYGLVIFVLMFFRSDYDTSWPGLVRSMREP